MPKKTGGSAFPGSFSGHCGNDNHISPCGNDNHRKKG